MSVPLHFLKVIDFEEQASEGKTGVFLHLVFEAMINEVKLEDKSQLKQVIDMGLNDNELGSFGKGLSQYLLTTFYMRIKKQYGSKD